ncbi:MAG TPA: hypothetical protein V6C86_21130 [Oculatellaceae cyanobacterium]
MSNYGARAYDGLSFKMHWLSTGFNEALVTFFGGGAPQQYNILNETNKQAQFSYSAGMTSVSATVTLTIQGQDAVLKYSVQYEGQQPGPVDTGTLGTWTQSDSMSKKSARAESAAAR